ncbi:MAG TPA: DoxX family protein [Alphaproteobacteria bacterium]|nr:DoxX family protein [Alphaproteobacteria bacterium]
MFYLAAGYVHLAMPNTFMPVMPDWVPAPYQVILFTGACEVAGAIGLIVPRTRWLAGLMLALYAVAVFPVNIKHAIYGPSIAGIPNMWYYHGPRLLLQPVLVWWALYAGGVTNWPFSSTRRSAP